MGQNEEKNKEQNFQTALPVCMLLGGGIGVAIGYFAFHQAIFGALAGMALGLLVSAVIPKK